MVCPGKGNTEKRYALLNQHNYVFSGYKSDFVRPGHNYVLAVLMIVCSWQVVYF